MAVHYCALCRRSSFSGRRHLYSAAHRRRLREALGRLQDEVAAARAAAAAVGEEEDGGGDGGAAVRRYDPAEHDRRVWPEHRRETARFWREHRAEAALREQCVVPAEEYERYERALERAVAAHQRREEERIQQVHHGPAPAQTGPPPGPASPALSLQMAADIREAERRQRETVRAALQVGEPLWTGTAHPAAAITLLRLLVCSRNTSHDAEQPGPSGTHMGPDLNWMEPSQALTFIGHQDTEGKGNVHTGAKPPWLMEEEEDGSKQQIGPSYEEFLKQKEKQKLKKLPPERVGANFDHTSQTGDGWLPSFGRVWNHGRRWQSR
ncbi:CCD84 protein, partial [Eolophus roseicapillus]|nr:CCD84 protein [Eolophus roseicapilla]